MPDLKIFISSPGDVPDERLRADLIIDKLAQDYDRFFKLISYRWEHEPMLASGHFQDAIEPPSATDIVILIVWSRLGTPLPEKTAVREYRGIDGRAPVTGTEWEYEDALAGARAHGSPGILAFRNVRPAPIDTYNAENRAKSLAQLDALDQFWRRHFAEHGVFISAYESYQTLDEFARLLEQKLRKLFDQRIGAAAAGGTGARAISWTGSPFRGLEPYEYEHAPVFFGREAAIAQALRHLAVAARHDNAFLLVAGASGSGKSSLVKAGIVPQLMKPQRIEGLAFLRRAAFRPADAQGDLVLGLVQALAANHGSGIGLPELLAPGQTADSLAALLRTVPDDPSFVFEAALGRITEAAQRAGVILAHEQARMILVIDQLEELFTSGGIPASDRLVFVKLLAGLAASGLVWIVATMRSDFWHRIAEVPELLALAAGERRLDLAPPVPLEFADMIRKPVEAAGLSFERRDGVGLDAELAKRAAAEPGVLPLLSFTLDALFAEDAAKKHGLVLTYETYESLGGLEGAIATRAEEIVKGFSEPALDAIPRVLRALTTVADGVESIAAARAAPLDAFPPGSGARLVVDALVTGRLLVASGENEKATVRVAHEALIRHWRRAEQQVELDRRDLETRKLIERQYDRWRKASPRDQPFILLRDPDLTNARDLDKRWGEDLQSEHRDFIARSVSAAQRAARRRWTAVIAAMAVLIMLTGLSISALTIAETQRDAALIAQSRALARDSVTINSQGNATLAALLALNALPRSLREPDRPFILDAAYPLANAFANRRERAVLAHSDLVNSIAFSPDGTLFATASNDGTAVIWDAISGRRLWTLTGHKGHVNSVEFSRDDRRAVTASDDGSARLWDTASGKSLAIFGGHTAPVAAASFSPDGTHVVTASWDGTAAVFDTASGARLAALHIPDTHVISSLFSPDGSKIATASDDDAARIWTTSGQLLHELKNPGAETTVAAFSPDGSRILTAANDGTARVWDAASYGLIATLRGHLAQINTAAFSPDGRKIITASDDRTARIWDADTGASVLSLIGHDDIVYSGAFSANGNQVVTASADRTARIWDARSGFVSAVLGGHEGFVFSALFAPDGRGVATAAHEPKAHLWNTDASAARGVLRANAMPAAVAFSPDGTRIATGSRDGHLRLWDGRTGETLAFTQDQPGPVRSLAFSPDGKSIVATAPDGVIRIWDLETNALRPLAGHGASVNMARFSSDGERIVTASDDKTARIWAAKTGRPLGVLPHDGAVVDAVFSPDGARIVTASADRAATLWNAKTMTRLAALTDHKSFVTLVAFSPDGKRIVTGGGQGAELWDGETGAPVATLPPAGVTALGAAFSPDGNTLAVASVDRIARLWDARDGRFLRSLTGHALAVRSVAYSRDGRRLITSSDDLTTRFWDAATGQPIAILAGHEAAVVWSGFAPDGTLALSASTDGTVRLWTLPPLCQDLIDAARNSLPRDLTSAERDRFFLGETKPDWRARFHTLAGPLLALAVPRAGDICR
ncbi:MAG: hypothetical protein P4L76_01090 [Beijerinckiaceae bacterium]|nr:hypothetical protein [Beijerinckiaceae bacterium]